MVRPWSAKPLSHFRKAYPSTTISASSVFFYFCLFFQRISRDVPLHYAESTEKALAAFFYVQIEINGMKYFALAFSFFSECLHGALRGVPARRGSGQATKRREAALLAGTIRGATCLGARGRLSPPFVFGMLHFEFSNRFFKTS